MRSNKTLLNAFLKRDDEYYTKYEDIVNELSHYTDLLKGKVIYCNCDNPYKSNFVKYFEDNFNRLHLKKLYATNWNGLPDIVQLSLFEDIEEKEPPFYYEYDGKNKTISRLNGNGNFSSPECKEILKKSDIVITNPPFSLLRKYMNMLLDYNKKFLIIGTYSFFTYEDFFKYIKSGEFKMGWTSPRRFLREEGEKAVNCSWYTNLDIRVDRDFLVLDKHYNPDDYPKYDNCDAIEVNSYRNIPCDYDGYMGVPVSFLEHYNPDQFEMVGLLHTREENMGIPLLKTYEEGWTEYYANGEKTGRKTARHKGSPYIKGKLDNKVYNYNPYTDEYIRVCYCRFIIKNRYPQKMT